MSNHIVKLALDATKFVKDMKDFMTRRETTPVDIVRMAPHIEIPRYATDGAAGLDLRAAIPATITIGPGKTHIVPTGLKMAIRDPNIVAMLFPRGGKGTKEGLVLANGTGVVDSDYRGEIMVPVVNRNHNEVVRIEPNERIAQMVLMPAIMAEFREVHALDATDRGEGRFSSTGKQ